MSNYSAPNTGAHEQTMTAHGALTAVALALALAACGGDSGGDAVCGDNVCDSSESASTCAEDCGCGNGVANPGESCDGTDFGNATCESETGRGGTLACNSDCTLDTSGCNVSMCGNGVAEPGEDCDGTDLGEATCATEGFTTGDLACDSDCKLVVSACCNDFCSTENETICSGDMLQACTLQTNGCLEWEVTDCAATNDVCDDTGGSAMCICVDRCTSAGATHCAGDVAETCTLGTNGCLDWVADTDCSTGGQTCAVGPQGPTCVPIATAEDCSDAFPLMPGQNVVAWSATTADYLTTQPSCNTYTLDGPDLVLSYTAPADGIVTFSMDKPTSARQVIVVSSDTCGTLTTEVSCLSDYSPDTLGDTFAVTMGTTYYFYVRDTTSGSASLRNPLVFTLSEAACATFTNNASNLSPANGASLATTSPVLSVDLDHPASSTAGIITITGDMGTNLSYDLSTSPSEVTFSNGGRTITIDPAGSFQPSETLTVSWSGLLDAFCGAAISPPTWSFSIQTPSCTPGAGGMVGNTTTRLATDIGTFSEYYVAADTDPNGYVYVGGTVDLFRVPKAGGPSEDIYVLAGISSTQLGYGLAIVGNNIFTADTTTSTSSTFMWRLSTSGGTTWNPLGYGQFPSTPDDNITNIFHYKGRLYMVTDEISSGVATQIWSVSANAVLLPDAAVLEGSVSGEEDCDGISGDDNYFYLTCATGDRIVRVDRATFQSELVTDTIDLSFSNNAVHAHDFDGDGSADALYVHSDEEKVHYICSPAATGPFWVDILADYGTGTSNYGLGFDPVNKELWAYDDDTQEFVSIK